MRHFNFWSVLLMLDKNINSKKSTKSVLDSSEDISLEVNTEETKYMFMFLHHIIGQS